MLIVACPLCCRPPPLSPPPPPPLPPPPLFPSPFLHHLRHCLHLPFASHSSRTSSRCHRDGGCGCRHHQKGAPRVRRGRRRRRWEGVDNDDGGRADFADAKLADDAGDVAAAAIARDLARGAAIPAGGEGGGGGGGGSAGASGWLLQSLTSRCRRLSSSLRSAASCPLMPPLPFASCTPPLFASCLPASCHVAPVVAPPPPPPRDFALTSSFPSGCRNSQCPICCAASASCPLATSALQHAASAS